MDDDVDDDVDDQIREATNGNFVLGNTRFQEEIARALGRQVTKGKAGRPKKIVEKSWSVPYCQMEEDRRNHGLSPIIVKCQ